MKISLLALPLLLALAALEFAFEIRQSPLVPARLTAPPSGLFLESVDY
jgi:hypothetical protein